MKIYFLLCSVFLLLVGCIPQTANYASFPTDLPQLVVQAEGAIQTNPDQLQLRLGVVTEAVDAGDALAQNNQRMAVVIQMLEGIGISAEEMATGQFQVRPEWSRAPRPAPTNWQSEIIGYRVTNELLINTTKVELAGDLLSFAQQSGANQIGGLQFSLADPTTHQQKAIEIATEKAIRKARTMATAAGVTLGAVQSISLDQNGGGMQPRMMLAEARMASAEPVPVAAGKVEISAAVTIIYRLENVAVK